MRFAVVTEGALALAAIALGAWLDVPPLARIEWSWRGLVLGFGATAPLLLALAWCLRTRLPAVAKLVAFIESQVAPAFAGSTLLDLALVATLAGFGEELLFRGAIEGALDAHLPAWVAIGATAILFGLAHWLTPAYAFLAGIVGAYLGVVHLLTGNLLVPIVAHALYDLVALALLVLVKPAPSPTVL